MMTGTETSPLLPGDALQVRLEGLQGWGTAGRGGAELLHRAAWQEGMGVEGWSSSASHVLSKNGDP